MDMEHSDVEAKIPPIRMMGVAGAAAGPLAALAGCGAAAGEGPGVVGPGAIGGVGGARGAGGGPDGGWAGQSWLLGPEGEPSLELCVGPQPPRPVPPPECPVAEECPVGEETGATSTMSVAFPQDKNEHQIK